MRGWIGVDLDGTLMVFQGNKEIMGPPIPLMVIRVKAWIAAGRDVRIFTARITHKNEVEKQKVIEAIEGWCRIHLGKVLKITNVKDWYMEELWDDKAVTVIKNTGMSWREYVRKKRRV